MLTQRKKPAKNAYVEWQRHVLTMVKEYKTPFLNAN